MIIKLFSCFLIYSTSLVFKLITFPIWLIKYSLNKSHLVISLSIYSIEDFIAAILFAQYLIIKVRKYYYFNNLIIPT